MSNLNLLNSPSLGSLNSASGSVSNGYMTNATAPQQDRLFGLHAEALKVQRSRMEVLASNLANADTPNYRARDIDFSKVLSQMQAQSTQQSGDDRLVLTQAGHLSGVGIPAVHATDASANQSGTVSASTADDLPLSYRVPLQASVDGNTVDTQIEQAQFADAAMHYQASLNFIDGRLKGLMTAITGQ